MTIVDLIIEMTTVGETIETMIVGLITKTMTVGLIIALTITGMTTIMMANLEMISVVEIRMSIVDMGTPTIGAGVETAIGIKTMNAIKTIPKNLAMNVKEKHLTSVSKENLMKGNERKRKNDRI